MKIIFTLVFLLLGFALGGVAQNAHWGHMHPTCKPNSAVTVMHSNDTAYLFYADDYTLVVSAIDANTLLPLGIDYYSRGRWSLQGAYEDFSHRIVVYGSYNDAPWTGLFDISSFQFTSSKALPQYTFDNIVNGCCGYDMNGNAINMFVFDNFSGSITYKLYDLCGRLIVSGSTSNGLYNHLPYIKGFYCLVAEDSSGRQLVKKIVVQ